MRFERLDWDSDFFGLRIGRVVIDSLEESARLADQGSSINNGFDLLYVFTNHGMSFSASGAKLMDEKVVYSIFTSPNTVIDRNIILWSENRGVSYDLLQLALISGKYSRFRLDDRLPYGSYKRLYSRWIELSVNRVIASNVFCYMVDDVPIGLVTISHKNGIGNIGLVAVHEDFQHSGIGTAMIGNLICYAHGQQLEKLTVATQRANVPACKLYEKCGFKIETISDVWHWWL